MKLSRIIRPHSKGCRSKRWSGILDEGCSHFWGNYAANKDVKGAKFHYWYVVSCNDPNCEGEKAVHSSVLANA